MKDYPVFDIIVPACKNPLELRACLQSLEEQRFQSFRVLLCLDGPETETLTPVVNLLWSFPLRVLCHSDDANHGPAATRNLALPWIKSLYVLLLDSDLKLAPEAVQEHLNMLQSGCGPLVSAGHVEYTNKAVNFWGLYQEKAGKGKYEHGKEVPFHFFTTQNTALPSEGLCKTGGFDEYMQGYGGDDTEFACRLWKYFGYPVYLNRKALASGAMNKYLAKAMDQMEEFGRLNFPYILKKHPGCHILFRFDLYRQPTFKGWLLRTFLRRNIGEILFCCLKIAPAFLKEKLVKYIAVSCLYEGYRKSIADK